MKAFAQAGGRLFKIALLFTAVCVVAMGVMVWFTLRAMNDVKEIATIVLEENQQLPRMDSFYMTIINNMKIQAVIGSLSGVLIAIAARYGLRETSKNIGEGMKIKSTTTVESAPDSSRVSTTEEVGK